MSWYKNKEWIALICMLFATGIFWVSTPEQTEFGASIFPYVVMGMMFSLAVIKIIVLLLVPVKEKKEEQAEASEPKQTWRFWFVMASMIVYALAVEYIGFYVSSFAYFFGVTMAIQVEERTPRAIAIRLAVVLGFLLFLHLLFTKVLMAQLPKGLLF